MKDTNKENVAKLGSWEAVSSLPSEGSSLILVRFRAHHEYSARFDIDKKQFIDPVDCLSSHGRFPNSKELSAWKSQLFKWLGSSTERQAARVASLTQENSLLQEELKALKDRVADLEEGLRAPFIPKPQPKYSFEPQECYGGCSRGGSGPSCGKPGCRG